MTLRSAFKFEGISTLILRIDAQEYGSTEKTSGRRRKIVEALQYDWEAIEADLSGDVMSLHWDGSGDPGGYLSGDCQASQWRHNYVVPLSESGAMFVQVGSRASDNGHDVRLIFDNFSQFHDRIPETLFEQCGCAYGIDWWRVTVEKLQATYALNGLSLEDIEINLPGYPARAVGKMVAANGTTCGLQAGRRIDENWSSATTKDDRSCRVKNRYDWKQARELAIRNRRPVEGELPAVQFDYQLPGPVTLLELQESINPLAGVQLSSNESRAGTQVVECWNPRAAWAKIFKNLRLSLIGEEPPAR